MRIRNRRIRQCWKPCFGGRGRDGGRKRKRVNRQTKTRWTKKRNHDMNETLMYVYCKKVNRESIDSLTETTMIHQSSNMYTSKMMAKHKTSLSTKASKLFRMMHSLL
mmetsp:Transcript_17729/g.27816  ORF Transcript_17729/g.27816 Transcript_17729/m.27816 type:complete len:107 (-) Transcript_17729:38-358(-)